MSDVKNILFVGVGGQGIILASKILSKGLIDAGYDVKMSEVHGMAQRGGSVTTQIRYGKKVYSPIIGIGQADIIVSFEKMEAMRWIEHLKPQGKMVVNDYAIPPAPVLSGKVKYPKGIVDELKDKVNTITIDAAEEARQLGNIKTQNIIMLGALIKAMGIDEVDWESVIKEEVKEKFVDINLKAFNIGKDLVK
ncbi:indolepyruvate ferredoxin oxidoreductase, beta subunit [Proteiniborus sp. DW1]|uniref:indolepyruvate oxidoreductase subunit beta n=1 Tax=Proteiniborus sp. DW1 TaxID=1889883 RepID=UPI00092E02E7|nr:indolepyruvate oxidoreductase subunit beta [Proteiniborus sp. DW1]SCG82663.1 indolepyruvate ferredoxin oxidoreductase, beta subunit [Proteiniborus sp. DW1]